MKNVLFILLSTGGFISGFLPQPLQIAAGAFFFISLLLFGFYWDRKTNLQNKWNYYAQKYSGYHSQLCSIPEAIVQISNKYPDWEKRFKGVVEPDIIEKCKKDLVKYRQFIERQNEQDNEPS